MTTNIVPTSVTGNAAPAHPCARGICASLHIIDVRDWIAPEQKQKVTV